MFANIVDTLQGPATEAVDDSATEVITASPSDHQPAASSSGESAPPLGQQTAQDLTDEQGSNQHKAQSVKDATADARQESVKRQQQQQQQQQQGSFSWWGMASGLADSVRKNAADIAARCSTIAHETCSMSCLHLFDMVSACFMLLSCSSTSKVNCTAHSFTRRIMGVLGSPVNLSCPVCRCLTCILGVCYSVKETDWRAELDAFRQGVAQDATAVQVHTERAVQEGRARLQQLQAEREREAPAQVQAEGQQGEGEEAKASAQFQRRGLPQLTPAQKQQLEQVGVLPVAAEASFHVTAAMLLGWSPSYCSLRHAVAGFIVLLQV